ncbi:MAG: immune inhibitor A, partial [Clostridia bacterium]|nr:immune inhibitor A [Clostridia bacterium]
MKKRATVLLASALLLGAMTVTAVHTGAVPADPTPFLTEQPDGTAITVRTYGDEHFNWNEDDDGWLICYSEDDGAWYYAELDENNDLVPGPFAVGKENTAYVFSAEPAATRLAFEDIAEIAESRAEASIAASVVCLEELPYAEEAVAPASASSAAASYAAKQKNTSQDLLLLLIEYTDISMYETMDFWGDRYFGKGKNSVTDYYMDQTGEYDLHFNRINFTRGNGMVSLADSSVICEMELKDGVARVKFNRVHPGNTALVANDVKTAFSYVKEYIDFSGYKGDALYNNSYIRQDYFQTAAVIAGWEESNAGNRIHDQKIWAHAYRQYFGEIHNRVQLAMTVKKMVYSNGTSYEPYTLLSFMMHGELYDGNPADGSARTIGVGVSVHEMGHCLGLPDLYDTTTDKSSETSAGLSGFSVMASGNWGAKKGEIPGTTPVGLDAWSKIKLGFAEPVEISAKKRNVYEEL